MHSALPADRVRDGKSPLLGSIGSRAKRMQSPDGITAAKAFNEHRQSGKTYPGFPELRVARTETVIKRRLAREFSRISRANVLS